MVSFSTLPPILDSACTRLIAHYVVFAYRLVVELELNQLPADQHKAYRWWREEALLGAEAVHPHMKWYFLDEHGLTCSGRC